MDSHPAGGAARSRMLNQVHEVRRTLHEDVFYPPHAPRTESAAYARTHHQLVVLADAPCFICGVRQSTLHHPAQNPFGARAMETHHVHVEWALAGAVDLKRFNAQVVAQLRRERPDDPAYPKHFTRAQMLAWIDHHPDNLLVLCDIHHRHSFVGIHAISGPIWGAQNLLLHRYELEEKSRAK